jgi:muramoyltetrapeptide carboxypeptidase
MKESASARSAVKLPPVPPNAGVSVISPASFANEQRVESGMARLRALGFDPAPGASTQARGPLYFAGTPEGRLADLHAAFTNAETGIVAAVRGGYGSNYLLHGIDLDLIRNHPKPFFGYSDLTAIQLHLLDRLGLPAFHGPMVAADFANGNGVHLPSFRAALAGEPYALTADQGLRALKSGVARGILYGGCLSILVALLGTPWEPVTEGKLLFVEDLAAKPYQVDRMLWQLRNAGKLNGVLGIVFGEMLDCVSPGAAPGLLEDVILHFFHDADFPVAIGLRSGHVSRENVTLILGVEAELTVGTTTELRMLEPAIHS